jgi:hypothetical protein
MDKFTCKSEYTDFSERQSVYDFMQSETFLNSDIKYGLAVELPDIALSDEMFSRVINAVELSSLRHGLAVARKDPLEELNLIKLGLSIIVPALYAYETSYGIFTWDDLLKDENHLEVQRNNQTEANVDTITQHTETGELVTESMRTNPVVTQSLPFRQKQVMSKYPQENLTDMAPLPVDENGLPITQYDYASGLSDSWSSGTQSTTSGGDTTQVTHPAKSTTTTEPQHSISTDKTITPETSDSNNDNKTFVYEMNRYRTNLAAKWAVLDIISSYEYIYASEVI